MSLLTKLAVGALAAAAVVKSNVLGTSKTKARRHARPKTKTAAKAVKPAARSTAKKARRGTGARKMAHAKSV